MTHRDSLIRAVDMALARLTPDDLARVWMMPAEPTIEDAMRALEDLALTTARVEWRREGEI
jgi:hypothetical protein